MKQPETGKRIAELRLGKGLTQSELATLCNLSLRTIQRIESAEVEPRSYTVKLIFSQLGAPVFEGNASNLEKSSFQQKTRDFTSRVFNFKTDKMKKITLMSLTVFSMVAIPMISGWISGESVREKEKEALLKANKNLVEWFNSGNIDALMTLYSDDSHIVPANFGEMDGKDNIAGFYKILHQSGFRMKPSESQFLSVSESMAIDRGIWFGTAENKEISGRYLTQWRQKDGKWFIENDMTSIDPGQNLK